MVSKKRKTITRNDTVPAPAVGGSHLDRGHLEQPSHFGAIPPQPDSVAIRSVALQRLSEALVTLAKKKFSKREAGPSDAPHHLDPSMFKFLSKLTVRRLMPRKGTVNCAAADWWEAMTGTLFDVARKAALLCNREHAAHYMISWPKLAAMGRRVECVGASAHRDSVYYRLASAWKNGWLSGQVEQQKQIMANISKAKGKKRKTKAKTKAKRTKP